MTDTHVIFSAEERPHGGWQIKCQCPGGKVDYVTGFLDEQSIQNWLASEHRVHWLKVRGYPPFVHSPAAKIAESSHKPEKT